MESAHEVDITLAIEKLEDQDAWRRAAARKIGVQPERIESMELLKKSIDARKFPVRFKLRILAGVDEVVPAAQLGAPSFPRISGDSPRILIVGCGPAGMFAALRCLQLGLCPVILERGKDASARRFDLAPILRQGRVIEDSNYCFGEGGGWNLFGWQTLHPSHQERSRARDL